MKNRNNKGQFIKKGSVKEVSIKAKNVKSIKRLDAVQVIGLISATGFLISCVVKTYIS